MANKQDVENAYYQGVYDILSPCRLDLMNILSDVDDAVIDGFLDWLDDEDLAYYVTNAQSKKQPDDVALIVEEERQGSIEADRKVNPGNYLEGQADIGLSPGPDEIVGYDLRFGEE